MIENLLFWDLETIQRVYKWKQNLIKKPKKEKKEIKIDFEDYKDFMFKKWWIKIIDWQVTYQLDKLKEPFIKNWKQVNDWNWWILMKNINDKEILIHYKNNLKLKTKYNKLLNDLSLRNLVLSKKYSEYTKNRISKLENEIFTLKSKIIL